MVYIPIRYYVQFHLGHYLSPLGGPFSEVLLYYNKSDATELLIMRDPHYDRIYFASVKTLVLLRS